MIMISKTSRPCLQKTVPDSCKDPNGDIYATGCLKAFTAKIESVLADNPWILIGVGIGVLAILIFGMILSCCLCCAIRKADGDSY